MITDLIKLAKTKNYYEDLYEIPWKLEEINLQKNKKKAKVKKLRIGLINVPCNGFGDVIVCHTMYQYLKQWYPKHEIVICTTLPAKFKQLGIQTKCHKIHVHGDEECELYDIMYFKPQPKKFDIMICIPIINYQFNINQFKKFIPYANLFNTFTVSEYNGEIPPYTFPIGVGNNQLGLLLTDKQIKRHTIIKQPYALAYIQPSPEWGVHSNSCFLAFMNMICKKYHKKHKFFQIIIQQWIIDNLNKSPQLKHRLKTLIYDYYPNVWILSGDNKDTFYEGEGNSLILRGDILPKPREEFISLMKYSVKDILLTGDQSVTDCLSYCSNKHIWYQIAPWKQKLATQLAKHLPDKNIGNFRTSCGNLQSINQEVNYKEFLDNNDFRKLGKDRFDAILNFIYDKDKYRDYMDIVLHSRSIDSVIKKLQKKI